MDTENFIKQMPKAELHVHLEGTLEPLLVCRLAARNNMPLPTTSTGRTEGYDFHDLTSLLAVYYPNMSVLRTEQDFFDLAWAYLLRATAENVVHVEMFFDPQAHTSRGVPFATVIDGYLRAIVKAEQELKISSGLIMCFLRDMDADSAMSTLVEALPYRNRLLGVGLDSDERGNPPRKFATVFKRAREEGLMLTIHCDIDQQDSIEHIRQALEEVGVDRIDHGTNIVEDECLVEMVRKKGIGLTCCPISNSIVTNDFKGREIVSLLRRGVKVTVNSDDPAYFRGYATENMMKMARDTDLSLKELVQLQRNAFEIAWLSPSKRDALIEQLDRWEDMSS